MEEPDRSGGGSPQPLARALSRRGLLGAIGLGACARDVAIALPDAPASAQAPEPAAPTGRTQPRPRVVTHEVLEVGPGKRFASLTLAGCFMNSIERWNNGYTPVDDIARMGFRVVISPGPPGYYTNDSGSHSRRWPELVGWPPYEGQLFGPVIVEGEPGKAPPILDTDGVGDGVLYSEKGLFCSGNFSAVFRRLVIRGFRRKDGVGNYAAVRLGDSLLPTAVQGELTFEDCEISHCDNGIMGGAPGQSITLRRCFIHDNGNGTGRTHNLYIGLVDSLVVDSLLSTRCRIGHLLKTRAALTIIRNSRLIGGGGTESACLDAPNAGMLEMADVICEKSADSDAHWIVHYAGENQDAAGMPFHPRSSIRLRGLTLVAPARLSRRPAAPVQGWANMSGAGAAVSGRGSRLIPIDARDIQVHGLSASDAGLPCRVLPVRPPLDMTSPVAA